VGLFRRAKTEDRSLPQPENELPWLPGVYTGPTNITPVQALAIGDVWACVRLMSDAASSLPIHVYRRTQDGREQVTSGKLVDLLEQPAPATTQADLISSLMAHLLIHGSAYVAKYRDAGEISQLGLLNPERVRPKRAGGDVIFEYTPGGAGQQTLTTADVVHIRGLSMNCLHGMSAVYQASRVIGLSDELVRHALEFFETGAPVDVFRMPPESTNEQKQGYLEALHNSQARVDHVTGRKSRHILVIEGEGSLEKASGKMDDAQFVEQRRLAAQEVARCFRVPPNMIGAGSGGDSLTYSTVEQQSLDFVRYSLQPWLRRIELALSGDPDLAFQRQFVKFEIDGLLRADSAGRAAFYSAALDPISGWMDVDEVRQLEDLPPRGEPTPQQVMTQAVTAAMTNGAPNGNG
jgi:HK97 family phage portal protein